MRWARGWGTCRPEFRRFLSADLPVLAAVLITASTVLSLVTILAIYREGGILKRLRATPLRPPAILAAHVLVKLFFTALTLGLMVLAGRRYYPVGADVPLLSFTLALLLGTISTCAFGFLIASLVPTARFAQPIGALVFYPMLAVSGLFTPVAAMPVPVQGRGARAAADLCGVAHEGHLARRGLARPHGRRRRPRPDARGVHRALGACLSLGVGVSATPKPGRKS